MHTAHHNTTLETGQLLLDLNDRAKAQEDVVLGLYRQAGSPLSPSQVWTAADELRHCPLTSIRRAISNLTRQGKLVKTSLKVRSVWGRPEYMWMVNIP